jgi:hypothetical protein
MTYWFNEYAIHHRVNWERHQAQVEKHIYPYIGDLPLSCVKPVIGSNALIVRNVKPLRSRLRFPDV